MCVMLGLHAVDIIKHAKAIRFDQRNAKQVDGNVEIRTFIIPLA